MMSKSILSILLLIIGINVMAQAIPKLHFPITNFAHREYNAGTQNWNIIQLPNGWIYTANNNGMMEFDGQQWRHFPVANESNVRALCVGDSNRIYVGASKEFGYFIPDVNGTPSYHSLLNKLPNEERKIDIIWKVHQLGKSYCFITDKHEIFQYQNDTITVLHAPHKIIYSAVINNLLYIATNQGLFFYSDHRFHFLSSTEALQDKRVCGLKLLPNGNLLIATESNGLYCYSNRNLKPFKTEEDPLLHESLAYCIDVSSTHIAVGTIRNGVIILDLEGRAYRHITKKTGLQNQTVLSIFFDKNGSLWLGLDSGIDLIHTGSSITNLYENGVFFGAGYCSLVNDNRLYFGTNQGLFTTTWPTLVGYSIVEIPALHGQVWNLSMIDNRIFCGHHEGAFEITGLTARKIGNVKGVWKFLPWSEKIMLAGAYDGFYKLVKENGQWKLAHKIVGFDESCRVMEWDQDGSLWMSHGNIGVYRFRFNESMDSIVSRKFYSIQQGFPSNYNNAVYKIKNQIVFTTTNGLYEHNPSTDLIEKRDLKNSVIDSNLFYTSVKEGSTGCNWFTANGSLGFRQISDQEDNTVFGLFKGELIGGFEHINLLSDSVALCSHENGFSLINTAQLHNRKQDTQTIIRALFTIIPTDSLVYGNGIVPNATEPVLPYRHNSFRIVWATPVNDKYAHTEYSYLLTPFPHETWSTWSDVTQKEYTNLPEGHYEFKVRTRSLLLNQVAETCIHLRILPPWYRSAVAYGIYGLLILFALFSLIILINKKIERNRHRIELLSQSALEAKEKKIEAIREENLQNELIHKNQELANSVMNVIRKNEMLSNIRDNVSQIYQFHQQKDTVAVRRKLLELQTSIDENISYDDEWKKFEQNFDLANSNYLKCLLREFPTLTLNEKKLCAFLKMDLSTKEIAPLLGISARGVEICRYRLRKKFCLDRGANLSEFLKSYGGEQKE